METKRTFLAIDIEPEANIVNLLEGLKRTHRLDSIKWVNPEIMHLTLFFLGDTPIDQIPDMCSMLNSCVQEHETFDIELKGLGVFGRPLPRVIWVGVEFPEAMIKIKHSIDAVLEGFGYNDDDEKFNPHLTLGRIKFLHNTDKLNAEIQQYKTKSFQLQTVKEVMFYESILRPQGPEYRAIQRFKLKGC
jgi:2'-5' RNA ligase